MLLSFHSWSIKWPVITIKLSFAVDSHPSRLMQMRISDSVKKVRRAWWIRVCSTDAILLIALLSGTTYLGSSISTKSLNMALLTMLKSKFSPTMSLNKAWVRSSWLTSLWRLKGSLVWAWMSLGSSFVLIPCLFSKCLARIVSPQKKDKLRIN